VERLGLHGRVLDRVLGQLEALLGAALSEQTGWSRIKAVFAEQILGRDDFEHAQTFFNSITRRLFPHVGTNRAIDFVGDDFPLPWRGWEMADARTYSSRGITAALIARILRDADFRAPFANLGEDCERAAVQASLELEAHFGGPIEALDVLRPVFVRNKAAYLVGRARRRELLQPFLLAVLHDERGLRVDAVIQSEDVASTVFSFARWYFHAEAESPRALIAFLHSILPRKRIAELSISLGYTKHGKTELYLDLLAEIGRTRERFVRAPGQRGLVMIVFTLPTWEFVVKVIKDEFPPSKAMSRAEVMAKYRLVLHHDRVGRLVDFQEFEDLALPLERFSPELLDELLAVAGRTVAVEGPRVVIRHAYVGRRVSPLDLYLRDSTPPRAEAAVADWGQAIKDLGAANLFAGDMLPKNFGVTRHGRVVFYDYDEIRPLAECHFRRLPPPLDDYDEIAAVPASAVDEADVFPEEFVHFLGLSAKHREVFLRHHRDLLDVGTWKDLQQRVGRGELVDVFPYRRGE
jgi:isocitrate dehydrogenase kinase/phosphatase